jgi:hypothetical protein
MAGGRQAASQLQSQQGQADKDHQKICHGHVSECGDAAVD